MMTAGSPGVTCRSAKTAMATTPMTGTVATRRRRISANTRRSPSGDRDVPEQRRDELQDAADALAVRGRQDVLAPRHVGDLVQRDLLHLLGELLALRRVGGPH